MSEQQKDRIIFPPSDDDKGYPFKASYDSYGSEDVTAIAKQALLYDQPGTKLIFVSCAQELFIGVMKSTGQIVFQRKKSRKLIGNKSYFCQGFLLSVE